jgi:DNA processing protein
MTSVSDEKILDWLQLINTDGVGPITFYKLTEKFGSVSESLRNLGDKYQKFPRQKAVEEFENARKKGIYIICRDDEYYPPNLKNIDDCPPLLYVLGNPEILKFPLSVSIVGARNASVAGRKTASKIAYDLTNSDIVVVSGMARGIDAAAHKGAMYAKNQLGPTIAVLGTGVDTVYPAENRELYEQIARQGVLISELPLGTKAQVSNFPRRNRIVSAISCATLVVEATMHSGSLITAKTALEQGREIFAVPGSPLDDRSSGPNHLIKEGAYLTESAEDIINVLSGSKHQSVKTYKNELLFDIVLDNKENNDDIPKNTKPVNQTQLLDFITPEGVYVDELIRLSGLDGAEVSLNLLEMEMSGKIVRQVGNKVALAKKR